MTRNTTYSLIHSVTPIGTTEFLNIIKEILYLTLGPERRSGKPTRLTSTFSLEYGKLKAVVIANGPEHTLDAYEMIK